MEALYLYNNGDKIVVKETGEVLTVLDDLSDRMDPGILVQEHIGVFFMHADVRPAGRTRQRRDAAVGITAPEPPPPPPENRIYFEPVDAPQPDGPADGSHASP